MAPKINKIGVISTLIIFFLISIPGVWAYYFADWKDPGFFTDTDQRQVIPEFQEDSRAFGRRILLRKDKGIIVNKSRLVFKGVADHKIRLDVYLLELDRDYPYPHYISTDEAAGPFRLGDTRFQLLKVSGGSLQLEVVDLFQS